MKGSLLTVLVGSMAIFMLTHFVVAVSPGKRPLLDVGDSSLESGEMEIDGAVPAPPSRRRKSSNFGLDGLSLDGEKDGISSVGSSSMNDIAGIAASKDSQGAEVTGVSGISDGISLRPQRGKGGSWLSRKGSLPREFSGGSGTDSDLSFGSVNNDYSSSAHSSEGEEFSSRPRFAPGKSRFGIADNEQKVRSIIKELETSLTLAKNSIAVWGQMGQLLEERNAWGAFFSKIKGLESWVPEKQLQEYRKKSFEIIQKYNSLSPNTFDGHYPPDKAPQRIADLAQWISSRKPKSEFTVITGKSTRHNPRSMHYQLKRALESSKLSFTESFDGGSFIISPTKPNDYQALVHALDRSESSLVGR